MRAPGHVGQRPLCLSSVILTDPCEGRLQFVFDLVARTTNKNYGAGIFLPGFLLFSHESISIGHTQFRTKIWIDPDARTILFERGIELARQAQNLAVGIM